MSAPVTRADDPGDGSRLRRLVQVGYALQALSLVLALFGDRESIPEVAAILPAALGLFGMPRQRQIPQDSPYAAHVAWQSRTFWRALAAWVVATLLFGPLLFIGLPILGWAVALIVAWIVWRIARGVHALRTGQPLATRKGKDA